MGGGGGGGGGGGEVALSHSPKNFALVVQIFAKLSRKDTRVNNGTPTQT